MLALFHDKNCCNYFNLFPCILWNFIVWGLVLSWWRIEHVLDEQVDFANVSRETYPREKHVLETEVLSQAISFVSVSREGLTR